MLGRNFIIKLTQFQCIVREEAPKPSERRGGVDKTDAISVIVKGRSPTAQRLRSLGLFIF